MLTPPEVYPLVLPWIQALGTPSHPTAQLALAHLVAALLVGQSLRPTALMRALPSPLGVSARQRYVRVARAWDRPWLTPAALTPGLVRLALRLVAPDPGGWPTAGQTAVALDSVRCGPWEIFTLGVVWHGRVLVVGWAVLPYPWPRGQFTPTICALVERVAAAWPAERPAHLVADRAFPSHALFTTLRAVGWGWTVRVRAQDGLRVGGHLERAHAYLATAQVGHWRTLAAQFGGQATAVAGTLVVGRGLVVWPAHQANPGSQRHRAAQQIRRQQYLAHKHPGRQTNRAAQTDGWLLLFSSHGTVRAALASYRRRWAIEGSYRDAQSGWDGQHGWDLEAVVARLPTAARVERVVGLWALGALLQTWLGHQVGQPTAPAAVQAVVRQWTTTGRLSVWARGQLALTEVSGALRPWLLRTLPAGARRRTVRPVRLAPTAPRRQAA